MLPGRLAAVPRCQRPTTKGPYPPVHCHRHQPLQAKPLCQHTQLWTDLHIGMQLSQQARLSSRGGCRIGTASSCHGCRGCRHCSLHCTSWQGSWRDTWGH
jgi:hypothetical protein